MQFLRGSIRRFSTKMNAEPKAPLDQYRKYMLSKVSHNFPEATVSSLLDPAKTNIIDFHDAIAPFEKRSPTGMRFDVPADQLHSLNENLIDMYKRFADAIVAVPNDKRTYENTFLPSLREAESDALEIDFLSHVSADKEVRDKATECSQRMSEFAVELSAREDIFLAQRAFAATEEYNALNSEQRKFVDFTIRDAKRRGLELEGSARDRALEIKKRLSSLGIAFAKNLGEDESHLWLTKDQLRGLSESHLNRFEKRTNEATGQEELKVTMRYPDYVPCMEQVRVGATRKALAKVYNSRCQETNAKIIEEMVDLRAELAALLGHASHAHWVQEVRMAKNPSTVLGFLNSLNDQLTKPYEEEMNILLKIKQREFEKDQKAGFIPADEKFDGKVEAWDRTWLSQLYEEEQFALDHEALAEYFPLETVTKGLFSIYERLLGLTFEEVKPEESHWVWHEDVKLYAVKNNNKNLDGNKGGETIGYFHMDLHPRPGKYGHAAVFGLVRAADLPEQTFPGSSVPVEKTAAASEIRKRQLPVCSLVCNFPKATADRPALLPHKDVVTFFHEFGHAMHQVCTEVSIPRFSGTAVERDFVEAPSQMLENWCYEPEALALMNGHWERKGEQIPAETIKQLQASKVSLPAVFNKRQLTFALLDQQIHALSWPEVQELKAKNAHGHAIDSAKTFNEVQKRIMGLDEQEGTNFLATFGHLAGGYDATYYGYLWSEVYAADMFVERFLKPGTVLSEAAGRDYRKWVLAKGGAMDGFDMLRGFLGREPDQAAFLELKGLKKH